MVEASLSRTVQSLIQDDPSLQDALERGYGNFSAIARLLKPKAEASLGKRVTLEGMISAVKRAETAYVPKKTHQGIIAESVINIRTNVAKISLEKTRRNLEKARLASADFPEALFQVLEGTTTLTLVTDERIFGEVHSVFREEDVLDEKQSLTEIIVQSPKEIVSTPGCIASFYSPIARAQINIEETISCYTETVIVVRMEDAARAFSLLTDLITTARKLSRS